VASFLKFEFLYLIFVLWCALYTVRWYFVAWPRWLSALYVSRRHAHLARWLDNQPEAATWRFDDVERVGAGRLALSFDLKREDITPRFFDADWALVFRAAAPADRIDLVSAADQPVARARVPSRIAD